VFAHAHARDGVPADSAGAVAGGGGICVLRRSKCRYLAAPGRRRTPQPGSGDRRGRAEAGRQRAPSAALRLARYPEALPRNDFPGLAHVSSPNRRPLRADDPPRSAAGLPAVSHARGFRRTLVLILTRASSSAHWRRSVYIFPAIMIPRTTGK